MLVNMQGLLLLSLSFVTAGVVRSQQQEFPYLSFMGVTLPNHSYVDINQFDSDNERSMHCHTDLVTCCNQDAGDDRGNWYSPAGTRLSFFSTGGNVIYFRRQIEKVVMRRLGTVSVEHSGIYKCVIETNAVHSNDSEEDGTGEILYVGAYFNGGDVIIPDNMTIMEFMGSDGLTSNFTLTCISINGPATTVSWTRDSELITEGTETILNNTMTSEYIHILTVPGRIPGEYTCHVSNIKPSQSSRTLIVEYGAPNPPSNLQALQNGLTSVLVSWAPGIETTNASMVISYTIRLTPLQNESTVHHRVDSSITSTTVPGLITGATYSVVIIANSHTLTSDEAGPINVTLAITENVTVNLLAIPSSGVEIGDYLSITCSATLPAELTGDILFQWDGPGGTLSIGLENTLVISSIHSSQAGQYTCTASISFFVISKTMDIIVQVSTPLPTIMTGRSAPIYAGTSYNLTCVYTLSAMIDSDPSIMVGWIVNDNEVDTSNSRISVLDDILLVFNPLTTSDSGSYMCTVTLMTEEYITVLDPQSQQSSIIEINVQDLPLPEVATKGDAELNIGDQQVLQCNASVIPHLIVEPTLQWISPDGSTVINSDTGRVLSHIVNVDKTSDAGVYVCRVTVDVVDIISVTSESSITLTVYMPQPSVVINPDRDGVLYAGTSLTLTCMVSLDSSVDTPLNNVIIWSGPRAIPGEWYTVTDTSGIETLYSWNLSISPLAKGRDDGEYSCTVVVGSGVFPSYIIQANSSDSTVINITNPPPLEVNIVASGLPLTGLGYEFECRASVVEDLIPLLIIELMAPNEIPLVEQSSSSILQYSFDSLEISDMGEYTCIANLTIPGSGIDQLATDTVSLIVVDAYPVEEFTLLYYNSTTFVFTWKPPVLGHNYTTHFTLTCTPITIDIPLLPPLSTHTGDELTLTLTDLYLGVLYNCSIVTVTTRGESEPKSLIQATEEIAPSGPPLSLQVVVGVSVVEFTWSPPEVILRNGEITTYTVTCISGGSQKVLATVEGSGTHEVEGFSPSTDYNCTVVATNSAGNGPHASISFTTQAVSVAGSSSSFETTPIVTGVVVVILIVALAVVVIVLVVVISKKRRQKYNLNRARPNPYITKTADTGSAVVTANVNAAGYCEGATPQYEMISTYSQLPPGKRPAGEEDVDVTVNKHAMSLNSDVDSFKPRKQPGEMHLYQSIDETYNNVGASACDVPKMTETSFNNHPQEAVRVEDRHYLAPRSQNNTITRQLVTKSPGDTQYSVPRSNTITQGVPPPSTNTEHHTHIDKSSDDTHLQYSVPRSNTITQGVPPPSTKTELHARIYNIPRSRHNTITTEQSPSVPMSRQPADQGYDRLESISKSSLNTAATAQAEDYEQPQTQKQDVQHNTDHSMYNVLRPSSMTSNQNKPHLVEIELGHDEIVRPSLARTGT